MEDVTPERWLPVVGYEGCYEVSDRGRVRSLLSRRSGRILKQNPNTTGRLHVSLVKGHPTAKKSWGVHVLVALAFLGPRPEGLEIRHLDGNCLNNRVENLSYGSRSENRHDSVRHGTHRNARKTHCPQDHEYTPENTYCRPGSTERQCRICMASKEDEKAANDRLRGVATRGGKPWTEPELEVAARPDLTAAEAAAVLGRSRKSVAYARQCLLRGAEEAA